MKEPRNPFRILSSEAIEQDATFLRLFGPGVLGVLDAPKEAIWDRIQRFLSAPGGGKTSLFRLFTPQSLLTLYESQTSDEYKELYQRLKNLNAISETGPSILGVYLSCARNYAALEDLNIEQKFKDRLLFSLLNSRIILAALRSILTFKKLNYPDDLEKIYVNRPNNVDIPTSIPIPCNGIELNTWASKLENDVCKAIDSFTSIRTEGLVGHDTLYCLLFLTPEYIRINNVKINARMLLMLDDIHKLAYAQRNRLDKALLELKAPIGIWLAERLEALPPEELLSEGALPEREYLREIILEEFWRGRDEQYEKIVNNIARRRVKLAPDVQIDSFEDCLQNKLDSNLYEPAFLGISKRIDERFSSTKKFDLWKAKTKAMMGTYREKAIAMRALEVIINREISSAQKTLVDFPISEKVLETKTNSAVDSAAEFFLSKEFNLPYYFGFYRLARLSSSNIEQFLTMAAGLFEEIVSESLIRKSRVLQATRQQDILKKMAKLRWDQIPRTIANGREVVRFLTSIQQLCLADTIKPNAPYAPGVTGIAISMEDRNQLIKAIKRQDNTRYAKMANIIALCISNNLLEASLDRKQGKKGGKTWMILYLNRLLCLHFGLPLQYGGWRPRSIDQLWQLTDQGYRAGKSSKVKMNYNIEEGTQL